MITEREPVELPYQETNDYMVANRPAYWRHGVFRIRVYEKPGAVPLVVASPLSSQPDQAVVTVTPYLSADILGRHFTCRLWEEEPMRWIEEEVKVHRKRGREVTEREYWQVTFRSFTPRAVTVQGERMLQLDERCRRPLKIQDPLELLGTKLE